MMATPKYPSNIKKYSGSIRENKRNGYSTFSVRVEAVSPIINKTFSTRQEAESFVRSVNIDKDLCKNKMLEYDEYFEVELTQGKWTKIDKEDLVHIEPHMFYYNDDGAGTRIGGKFKRLPHILLNYEPKKGFVVTHKNGDNLDNRKSNLEITPLEILRKRQGHSKKSEGVKGVCLEETWSSVWMENGKLKSKNFYVGKYGPEEAKAMAVQYRKKIEETHPVYIEALKYRNVEEDQPGVEETPIKKYPTNIKKYTGNIKERPGVNSSSFCATIRTKNHNLNKTFDSREKAEDFLRKKNVELELPIKNKLLEYEDYVEMELPGGKWTKIDKELLPVVDKHIFSVYNGKYALCTVGGKRCALHHLAFGGSISEKDTIDHINVDTFDNRRKNLRIATMQTQAINKKIFSNNSSGVSGVVFESCWVAKWKENGKPRKKSFSVKKYGFEEAKALATKLRLLKEETLEEYRGIVSQE